MPIVGATMLVLEGLTKAFGDTRAVQDVSLEVPAGQFVGVIGRSGAGKSTLLRMINRLAEPTAGRIVWRDTDVTHLAGRNLRDWRRRCAMIFQQFNLVGRLDVLNNVLLGRLAHTPFWRAAIKAWPQEDRNLAFAALDQFDMASARRRGAPIICRAASSSASRSAARWCRSRRSCWPTNPSRRSTRATPASSWTPCSASTGISA